mgnify:CR=1 FL=1
MSIQSLIDKPKQLLELINECLKPKDVEKKKFGEVFTPMKIVNEMLDKLPKKVWKNKELRWLDPATGMGNFPIAIYLRLMEGLKDDIKNEKERKKHILENMLYMCELNKKNVLICKQIFDINNEYKLNLYEGDTLKMKLKEVFNVGKFDVIVGNPPYNKEVVKHNISLPLYNEFVEMFIDKCKYMVFIIPSRWFAGGKGLTKFRRMMLQRRDIKMIKQFEDASEIFGKVVDIKGGVNYFLKDSGYDGECNFNGSMITLNKYDVFVDSKYYKLIDKLIEYDSIIRIYNSQDHYKVQSNDRRLCDDRTKLKCYVSKQKGFDKYIDKKYIKQKCDTWKIITTSASFKAGSGFGNTFIGKPNEIHCKSYISFDVKTEEEAKSLLSYMKCKLPNIMLSLRKKSHNLSSDTCKWIPLPPLDKKWTNKKVYKYFELDDDDIKMVRETPIIGYEEQ